MLLFLGNGASEVLRVVVVVVEVVVVVVVVFMCVGGLSAAVCGVHVVWRFVYRLCVVNWHWRFFYRSRVVWALAGCLPLCMYYR